MRRLLHGIERGAPRHWWATAATLLACTTPKSPSDWPRSTRELAESEPDLATMSTAVGIREGNHVLAATHEQLIDPNLLASLVPATHQPQESQGHQPPDFLIQVLVSPGALEAYRAWGPASTMPIGTWLVARHSRRSPGEPPGDSATNLPPLYAMWRSPDRWHFGATTDKGLKIPVIEGACQDCHTQARSDQIFGPATRDYGAAPPQDPSNHTARN